VSKIAKAEVVSCRIIHDHSLAARNEDVQQRSIYFKSLKSTCILTMTGGVCVSFWLND
jgi:hypothetical protein